MPKFYFTYGSEGQPFRGGWTEVEAPTENAAAGAFRAFHPDHIGGLLNCCAMYSEKSFKKTSMYEKGNFGARCRETITLQRTVEN